MKSVAVVYWRGGWAMWVVLFIALYNRQFIHSFSVLCTEMLKCTIGVLHIIVSGGVVSSDNDFSSSSVYHGGCMWRTGCSGWTGSPEGLMGPSAAPVIKEWFWHHIASPHGPPGSLYHLPPTHRWAVIFKPLSIWTYTLLCSYTLWYSLTPHTHLHNAYM